MSKATYSVHFTALSSQNSEIRPELLQAFETVLDSGQYILGSEVSHFEQEFGRVCESRYAAGVASGTCALQLVLRALGVGEGDEVITPPNSFVASAASIALVGARPVFVDIGADLNLDPDCIEDAITKKTKAIVPVHLTGRVARMPY